MLISVSTLPAPSPCPAPLSAEHALTDSDIHTTAAINAAIPIFLFSCQMPFCLTFWLWYPVCGCKGMENYANR